MTIARQYQPESTFLSEPTMPTTTRREQQHHVLCCFFCLGINLSFLITAMDLYAQEKVHHAEAHEVNSIQRQLGLDPHKNLTERIGDAPESVLSIFREAGLSPSSHLLTDDERQKFAEATAILPPLHQSILKQRLRHISFLDNMPNTALTSMVTSSESYPLFDIAIRASILHQSASEWMTEKESSCFDRRVTTFSLRTEIGNITALQYVFLHEATHIVDAICQVTPTLPPDPSIPPNNSATPFTAGVWEDARTPINRYLDQGLLSIRFRQGGKLVDASKMKEIYEALGRTPFVSLYGSSARTEDLAEYFTVYHLTQKLKQPFRISVLDGDREVLLHDPMNSEIVRARFTLMSPFYESMPSPPTADK